MRQLRSIDDITIRQEELDIAIRAYLRKNGWEMTCDTPGSLWLWSCRYKGNVILVDQAHAVAMQAGFESGIYDRDANK